MTENYLKIIQKFLQELNVDVAQERVTKYIIKELHMGRRLSTIIGDPYVKNRVDENKLASILENEEIMTAVEEELAEAFKGRDFKFAE